MAEHRSIQQPYVQQKLFNAISEENLQNVKFFLEKGAKINARNEFENRFDVKKPIVNQEFECMYG